MQDLRWISPLQLSLALRFDGQIMIDINKSSRFPVCTLIELVEQWSGSRDIEAIVNLIRITDEMKIKFKRIADNIQKEKYGTP